MPYLRQHPDERAYLRRTIELTGEYFAGNGILGNTFLFASILPDSSGHVPIDTAPFRQPFQIIP